MSGTPREVCVMNKPGVIAYVWLSRGTQHKSILHTYPYKGILAPYRPRVPPTVCHYTVHFADWLARLIPGKHLGSTYTVCIWNVTITIVFAVVAFWWYCMVHYVTVCRVVLLYITYSMYLGWIVSHRMLSCCTLMGQYGILHWLYTHVYFVYNST